MKYKLLILLLFVTTISGAQIINIPDANFKNALLSSSASGGAAKDNAGNFMVVDSNDDGEIQQSEALSVYEVIVPNLEISSLQGIEYFKNIVHLDCEDNQISELDLSGTNVSTVSCSNNNITFLNIKNGVIESSIANINDWSDNPLTFVCADEDELNIVADLLEFNNYTGVNVNTYCTFTPGGDHNTITGVLTFDADDNGCGPEDLVQQFIKVNVNNGSETISTFTNASGAYAFYTHQGEFIVTPEFENDYFTVVPESAVIDFPLVDNSTETENFCITADAIHNDVEVIMVPVIPARPGENAVYKIVYRNKGNQVLSGMVDCEWDTDLFSNMSLVPPPDVQSSGYYIWNYSNLQPFENREIIMTLTVNTPTDATPVNAGDILDFTATATQTGIDEMPEDNNFVLNQEVVNSFSANNIICIEGENVSPDAIGEYLHYVVNFQNTGSAVANSVVIVLQINPSDFDISTLQILNSSHDVEIKVMGNSIEFIFSNVSMAAAGHGNILFKLKSRPSLMAGDNVMNSANVYFDYNMPVTTNDAVTVFGTLNRHNYIPDASVQVYPNPANTTVNITADSEITSFELFDIQGRLLQSAITNDTVAKLDISQRAAGIYFLKVQTEKGMKVEKVVKK